MKKIVIAVIMLLSAFSSYAQLTNFHATIQFIACSTYDLDLQKTIGEPTEVNTTVVIDIGEDGTGKLILYLKDKTVFEIEGTGKVEKNANKINLICRNYNGKYIPAGIHYDEDMHTDAVWITDTKNNTQIIFFK